MCIYFIPHKLYELNGETILSEQSITRLKRLTSILIIDDIIFSNNYMFFTKKRRPTVFTVGILSSYINSFRKIFSYTAAVSFRLHGGIAE